MPSSFSLGVWFSVALAICVLSAWSGWKLGAKIAAYRFRSNQAQAVGTLSGQEHAHLESVLNELDAIAFLRLEFIILINDDKLRNLPATIDKIEDIRLSVHTSEAKPVMDMNLAFADVAAAIADEHAGNKERAASYMKSAQSLYQSLGWQDYSEATLRIVVERELDSWKTKTERSEHSK